MAGNTTSGGNALKFYASIRCEVSKEEELKRTNQLTGEEETYGIKIKIKNKKNKTSVPFKTGSMDLIFGKGFDIYGEYVDYGVKYKIITKSGSWYSYGEERLAQGRDNTVEVLKNNKALYESIKKKVQDILYNKTEELDPRTKAMVEAEEAKEKKEMFELGISKDVTAPEEGEEEVSGIQVVFEGTPEKPKRGRPSSK
jgi:recombination protein RecA